MNVPYTSDRGNTNDGIYHTHHNESCKSGVFWGAIIGGAVVATAVSLILITLGSSLGFASLSLWHNPWNSNAAPSITDFTVIAAIWLLVVQWVASALGGYLTGRLRTKWVGMHTDEVFFRDTAHGFLSWAVATILVAAFITSAASSVLKTGAETAAVATAAAAHDDRNTSGASGVDYYSDMLFRPSASSNVTPADPALRMETKRIFVASIGRDFSDADRAYLAQNVAARTGLSEADAKSRVDDVIGQEKAVEAKAKQIAEDARKAATRFSLFTFLALLAGAFIASAAAALGGIHRDDFETIIRTDTGKTSTYRS